MSLQCILVFHSADGFLYWRAVILGLQNNDTVHMERLRKTDISHMHTIQ